MVSCFLCLILAVLLIFLLSFGFLKSRLQPKLTALAKENVSFAASSLITEAVSEKMALGELHCDQIIHFEKDEEGRITALKTDMQQVNILKSRILSDLNQNIRNVDASEIGISLGDLILPDFFSGRGPKIPVRILTVRRSQADFISRFTQAGINQTLHRLTMDVRVDGTMLILGKIHHFSASGSVLVAETIIVGQVPHTFS